MKNKKNSPLNQESKFDTTAHDYGRRAHTMSPKERSDYRTGMGHALTFTPVGGVLGVAGKAAGVIGRNIGGGAHAIGQGLVRKFGTKGMKKTYDKFFTSGASQQTTRPGAFGRALESFSNMPKQYSTKVKPSSMNRPVAKPATAVAKPATTAPKPKEIKYQKRYHENEILEPKSGYYSSNEKGWPLPLRKGDL